MFATLCNIWQRFRTSVSEVPNSFAIIQIWFQQSAGHADCSRLAVYIMHDPVVSYNLYGEENLIMNGWAKKTSLVIQLEGFWVIIGRWCVHCGACWVIADTMCMCQLTLPARTEFTDETCWLTTGEEVEKFDRNVCNIHNSNLTYHNGIIIRSTNFVHNKIGNNRKKRERKIPKWCEFNIILIMLFTLCRRERCTSCLAIRSTWSSGRNQSQAVIYRHRMSHGQSHTVTNRRLSKCVPLWNVEMRPACIPRERTGREKANLLRSTWCTKRETWNERKEQHMKFLIWTAIIGDQHANARPTRSAAPLTELRPETDSPFF